MFRSLSSPGNQPSRTASDDAVPRPITLLRVLILTVSFCVVDTLASQTPTNAPGKPYFLAPSTRAMADLLARMYAAIPPVETAFFNEGRVEFARGSVATATNLNDELFWRFKLGNELLSAGRPLDAITEYDTIDAKAKAAGRAIPQKALVEMRIHRATAWLRLGEQENCISNHNADSCLFPLRGGAFYISDRGPRRAIGLLEEQLASYPDDLGSRWLLNLAHMTVAEYPDRVPAPFLIPPSVFASEASMPRFPDIAAQIGLDRRNLAGGCILDDFDNDGFIDVVVSDWAPTGQLRYYHNDGDGHFSDRTAAAGLTGIVGGLNIQQTDYNNDGLLDIFIMRGAWFGKVGRLPCNLLRNNGDGTFTDATESAGLLRFHPTQTAAWFDYDGDGWLDLFIGNETSNLRDADPCELFHNNGDGTFTECAAACGLDVKAFVKGVACADYDNDGRPDLYLSAQGDTHYLFHNDGPANPSKPSPLHWRFSDHATRAGVTEPRRSFPTWFFDYDNDGWQDLLVLGYAPVKVAEVAADYLGLPSKAPFPKLYHNNRDGTFTDVTTAAHLNKVCLTMGSNFGDLDNDGWLDFYLGTGNPDLTMLIPNRMFRNAEGRYFQEVTSSTDTGNLQKGHGVAFADLDNDGWQDVYVVLGGAFSGDGFQNALFHNPGGTNHWIKLKLAGVKANRAAIGARIAVSVMTPAGIRVIHRVVNSGGSFGSSPLMQHVGLGDRLRIEQVEVLWPGSNVRQVFRGLEPDKCYRIQEGDSGASEFSMPRVVFPANGPSTSHHHHAVTSSH